MKNLFSLKSLALTAMLVMAGGAFAQSNFTGIGPAISGSQTQAQLPDKARKFVDKHFKGQSIAAIQKDFADGEYDVRLADGTTLEFTAKGDFMEVEAAKGCSLATSTVKSIVPKKTYDELAKRGVASNVESVSLSKKGYEVELNHRQYDKVTFNPAGEFIAIFVED